MSRAGHFDQASDGNAGGELTIPPSDDAATASAREFCLYGTAQEIVERLATVGETGADAVFLQHVGSYDLPHELLTDVADQVLPLLGTAVGAVR